MLVYRVETEEGEGAYAARHRFGERPTYLRDMYREYEDYDPHPGPYDDGLGYTHSSEHFGGQSPAHIAEWFFREQSDARLIAEAQLFVSVYQVRRRFVREGGRQCVFVRDKALLVGRWTPQDFLDHFLPSWGVRWTAGLGKVEP